MSLNSTAYKDARWSRDKPAYAFKRLRILFVRVLTQIEEVNIFLGKPIESDKTLKEKISLLSQLLDVKRKIKAELKELEGEAPKSGKTLSELLRQ